VTFFLESKNQTNNLLISHEYPNWLSENSEYHIVFDVQFDVRHKARLVTGGNREVDEKEDIYSDVVRMDTV
jgi:hypothetical protein